MMSRLIALLLLLFFQTSNAVVAQITPNSHFFAEVAVQKDSEDESKRQVLKAFRKDLWSLFRGLPPVQVLALDSTDISDRTKWVKDEWKTKIEQEISNAGVKLKKNPEATGPRLVAHVFRNHKTKQWGSSLELKEDIILNRPDSSWLNCATYIDRSTELATKQEAEKKLFESVRQFCWLYKKFRYPLNR